MGNMNQVNTNFIDTSIVRYSRYKEIMNINRSEKRKIYFRDPFSKEKHSMRTNSTEGTEPLVKMYRYRRKSISALQQLAFDRHRKALYEFK